jgi:hypothetical protein
MQAIDAAILSRDRGDSLPLARSLDIVIVVAHPGWLQ